MVAAVNGTWHQANDRKGARMLLAELFKAGKKATRDGWHGESFFARHPTDPRVIDQRNEYVAVPVALWLSDEWHEYAEPVIYERWITVYSGGRQACAFLDAAGANDWALDEIDRVTIHIRHDLSKGETKIGNAHE